MNDEKSAHLMNESSLHDKLKKSALGAMDAKCRMQREFEEGVHDTPAFSESFQSHEDFISEELKRIGWGIEYVRSVANMRDVRDILTEHSHTFYEELMAVQNHIIPLRHSMEDASFEHWGKTSSLMVSLEKFIGYARTLEREIVDMQITWKDLLKVQKKKKKEEPKWLREWLREMKEKIIQSEAGKDENKEENKES